MSRQRIRGLGISSLSISGLGISSLGIIGLGAALMSAAAVAGCVEKNKGLTSSEQAQIEPFVSKKRSKPQHPLDISFEDKIQLIGYDISPGTWTPGRRGSVTWHWRASRALEQGWKLFTHLDAKGSSSQLNADSDGLIRRLYQPGQWKAGEYIRDRQSILLPADWKGSSATFHVGVWNGPHRLQVTRGPSDGENRARALVVPLTRAKKSPSEVPVRQARAARPKDEMKINGDLAEATWAAAQELGPLVRPGDGSPAEFQASVKLAWDDRYLYIGFDVNDDFIRSDFKKPDDHLWEQDCVEIMIDPDGDGKNYFEIQVAPTGVSFDTRYDSRRKPQPFGHVAWSSQIDARVAAHSDKPSDRPVEKGYVAEIGVPWEALTPRGGPPASKPNVGDEWRINFFVMDIRKDGAMRTASWSPPLENDFHVPERFGRLTFVDPDGKKTAPEANVVPQTAVDRLRPAKKLRAKVKAAARSER